MKSRFQVPAPFSRRRFAHIALAATTLLPLAQVIARAAEAASVQITGGPNEIVPAQQFSDPSIAILSAPGLFASADIGLGTLKASAEWDGHLTNIQTAADARFAIDGLMLVGPSDVAQVPVRLRANTALSGELGGAISLNHGVTLSMDAIGVEGGGRVALSYTHTKSSIIPEQTFVTPLVTGAADYSVFAATGAAFDAEVRVMLVPGKTYTLSCVLTVGAGGAPGSTAKTDGSHTATLTIDLPAGYQLQTTNGKLLASSATGTGGDSRLLNVSVRSGAGTGDQTLITGFVIGGTGSRQILVRGIGPGLVPFGVGGALPDPQLLLFSGAGGVPIQQNDDWGGGALLANAFTALQAFSLAGSSKDAAMLPTLAPGSYTAHVTSNAGTGIALTELYDAESSAGTSRLVNVSARSQVGIGGEVLIAGFVIGGTSLKTVLIRGVGPGLTPFGVSGVLANPQLRLFSGDTPLAANDNWGGDATLGNAFTATNAFSLATNSQDAALLATLSPGAYTAQVSGVGDTTGVALVEVYEMP